MSHPTMLDIGILWYIVCDDGDSSERDIRKVDKRGNLPKGVKPESTRLGAVQ